MELAQPTAEDPNWQEPEEPLFWSHMDFGNCFNYRALRAFNPHPEAPPHACDFDFAIRVQS